MKTDNKLLIIPDFMIALKIIGDGKKRTVTELKQETDISYSHLFKMKKLFLKKGWINIEYMQTDGIRDKHNMGITDKGLHLVKVIDNILCELDIKDDEIKLLRKKSKLHNKKSDEKNEVTSLMEDLNNTFEDELNLTEDENKKNKIEDNDSTTITEVENEKNSN